MKDIFSVSLFDLTHCGFQVSHYFTQLTNCSVWSRSFSDRPRVNWNILGDSRTKQTKNCNSPNRTDTIHLNGPTLKWPCSGNYHIKQKEICLKNKRSDLWPHSIGCNVKLHFYDGKQYKYPSEVKETLTELRSYAEFTAVRELFFLQVTGRWWRSNHWEESPKASEDSCCPAGSHSRLQENQSDKEQSRASSGGMLPFPHNLHLQFILYLWCETEAHPNLYFHGSLNSNIQFNFF